MRYTVYIGLGSNQNDPERKLDEAVHALEGFDGLAELRVSTRRWTAPVGPVSQPPFLNAVAVATTTLSPEALLAQLHNIESLLGRDREAEVRWGPRPIDLDLLLMGDLVRTELAPLLPHPEMTRRRFVLEPLVELAPKALHPSSGRTAAQLLASLP